MTTDICQAETGMTDPEAHAAWDRMICSFLAHGAATPVHLADVLDREPDAVLPLAAKGLFCLMLGRREMVATARDTAKAARIALDNGGGPPRARAVLAALETWLAGSPGGAIFHLEGALVRNPADTFTMKLCHGIRFIIGDAGGMRRSVERALHGHGVDHPLRGYALGCHAFALEETGDYRLAERAGLAGLDLAGDDAWGLHAVAHVYDMTHRPDTGIALLDENEAAWSHCNNFRFHVWWHKALLHLDRGELDRVLALYDTRIREEKTDDYRDVANASSLLVRLQLEGVDIGERWCELADLAETRISDGCLVFADLHYMLALCGDHRSQAARDLSTRIKATGTVTTQDGQTAAHPGQAAAQGLALFGEGKYCEAFLQLSTARSHMNNIGGSHAQRDVFERITVDAGIRAGLLDEVAAIVAQRTELRAGRADAFAESRMAQIETARRASPPYAAQ